MKEIIEYLAIKADTEEGLTYRVTNLIEEGWQPVGGMSVSITTDDNEVTYSSFHQALVKYGDDL